MNNLFQEAINHCRWKKTLFNILKNIKLEDYKDKNFEQIFIEIYNICEKIKGLGMLAIYDITSSICTYYNININKVYIIGNGPKRAIKKLNLKTKKHKIQKLDINYVEIADVINAFDNEKIEINKNIRQSKNGDIIESFLCNWQKKS